MCSPVLHLSCYTPSPPTCIGTAALQLTSVKVLCAAGIGVWAEEYLQLAAYTCVALLCSHVAALAAIQVSHAGLDALTCTCLHHISLA